MATVTVEIDSKNGCGSGWDQLPDLLTEAEVAQLLRIQPSGMRWRRAQQRARPDSDLAPRFVRLGRTIRYRKTDVVAWVDRHRTTESLGDSLERREDSGVEAADQVVDDDNWGA